jgi:2-polyprenyl-3-methyl-5-hydroxy-6-metoxy-1,4-benzoquinol methylase
MLQAIDDPAGTEATRTTRRACPACAGTAATLLHRLRLCTPAGHPLGDGYDVVCCGRCGTGFADVGSGQAYYDTYYAESAKYSGEATADRPEGGLVAESPVAESPHTAARMEGIADQVAALVPDRSARILDVGCANGTLLATLRGRGYPSVVGLDPAPECSRIAQAVHGVRVEVGTLSRLPESLGSFDFISMIGVLEHVWEMDEALTAVRRLLRPGGLLHVDVPDASRYLDPYIAPFQDFGAEHVNHFSTGSLGTLADRLGYEVAHVTRYHPELVPGAPSVSIASTWRCRDAGPAPHPPADDPELRRVLRGFTQRSAADFADLAQRLDLALADHERYAVWGAGEFTMKLLALPALARRELVAVVDGNPGRQGLRFRGVPVGNPGHLPPPGVPVVIGSLLSAAAIGAALERRGHLAVSCTFSPDAFIGGAIRR